MSLRSELRLAFDRAPIVVDTLARELMAFDRASVRSTDLDGRLHVDVCNISKATVNPYYGREIPNSEALGLEPDRIYRLYRDPVELEKAAPTFMRLQLLDTHIAVSADDPQKEHWVGNLGSDVRFEDPYLKASLTVIDARAIADILKKKSAQLSCSYRYRADMAPGVTPGGLAFDGVMRDIVGNHVALVKEGRAGPDVFVNDWLPTGLSQMKFKFPGILSAVDSVLKLDDKQRLALDQAFDKKAKDEETAEEANDAKECALDSREEAMDESEKDEVAKGDRAKARDSRKTARDKRAADRKAAKDGNWGLGGKGDSDPALESEEEKLKGGKVKANDIKTAVDEAIKAGGFISADAAKQLAADAVAAVQATEQAKREVAPITGPITAAMDSAEAVYRFALDQAKVSHKGMHASALSHVVAAEIRARKGGTVLATDSVQTDITIDSIFKAA